MEDARDRYVWRNKTKNGRVQRDVVNVVKIKLSENLGDRQLVSFVSLALTVMVVVGEHVDYKDLGAGYRVLVRCS